MKGSWSDFDENKPFCTYVVHVDSDLRIVIANGFSNSNKSFHG